jgi:hypothetical protein
MKKILFYGLFITFYLSLSLSIKAQTTGNIGDQPALNFLSITPDAKSAALGLSGVSTDADAFAMFHNPGKLARMINYQNGFAGGYGSWMPKVAKGMGLAVLDGFQRFNDGSVVGLDIRYFSLGSVDFLDEYGYNIYGYTPNEFTLGLTYSQKLNEHISLGGTLRYIRSQSTPVSSLNNEKVNNINAAGGDIGIYYSTKEISDNDISDTKGIFSFGAAIRNLGNKVHYYSSSVLNSQPTTVVGGFTYTQPINEQNKIKITAEAGKILLTNYLINGGIEYTYNDQFFARCGIHYEPVNTSVMQVATFGLGLKVEQFTIDISYWSNYGSNSGSVNFGQVFKIGLSININGDGTLMGRLQ